MSLFKYNKILITGGTGTFGNAFLIRTLQEEAEKIIVFSRDEKKQFDMFHEYGDKRIQYVIGDVRDPASVDRAMAGVDYVFHAAALKHVPSCEYNVMEAVKTNIIGTANVIDSAIRFSIKKVVVLSTDKAVYPCNAMGASKMLAEKVAVEKAREQSGTEIVLTRFGNLVMSRGSVIPLFVDQIKSGKDITVTDPDMTRFFMVVSDAIELVCYAFQYGKSGELFIYDACSYRLGDLVDALKRHFTAENTVVCRGARHGERMSEYLLTEEESHYAQKNGEIIKVDMSFNALRKPDGIPHFSSSSPERMLGIDNTYKIIKEIDKLYG
ncbi:MAG: polysaccharide biosynthesis protein [Treponema sp.]|jgi:UDP-glucose 4-epimerase|nr:polysaccharide biosynthesis protein [Treponema sp.]